MERAGQPFAAPMNVFSPGKGERPDTHSARRFLRNPFEASRMWASPADVFCPEAPCPHATTYAPRNVIPPQEAPWKSPGVPFI